MKENSILPDRTVTLCVVSCGIVSSLRRGELVWEQCQGETSLVAVVHTLE